ERVHHFARHALAGDAEVLERALRLRAPQVIRGHLDGAESVLLDAYVAHVSLLRCALSDKMPPVIPPCPRRGRNQRKYRPMKKTGIAPHPSLAAPAAVAR